MTGLEIALDKCYRALDENFWSAPNVEDRKSDYEIVLVGVSREDAIRIARYANSLSEGVVLRGKTVHET